MDTSQLASPWWGNKNGTSAQNTNIVRTKRTISFMAGATESLNPNNQVRINKVNCRSLEISAAHPKTPPHVDMRGTVVQG